MILGIGNDVVDIRRIERTLARFGDRFTHRIFTATERAKAERRPVSAPTYAKRFAAKEACSKALGTGFSGSVYWSDMAVVNEPSGRPVLKLSGGAHEALMRLTPEGFRPVIHLTMTDEYPYAEALVMISALPI